MAANGSLQLSLLSRVVGNQLGDLANGNGLPLFIISNGHGPERAEETYLVTEGETTHLGIILEPFHAY